MAWASSMLRKPQQGAGLGTTQPKFIVIIKLIKAPDGQEGCCCRAHLKIPRRFRIAAHKVVKPDQGQLFSRAHCSTASRPLSAALAQVASFQLQPFCRVHCRSARWLPAAAQRQVAALQLQPFCRAHCSTSRWPPCSCLGTGVLIPTAAILSRPLQDCKVARSGCA